MRRFSMAVLAIPLQAPKSVRLAGGIAVRLAPESVFGLERNQCSACGGISVRLAAEYARKDGTPFAVEVRAGVVTYKGAPAELALLRDVSERKRAEEALRESEERFALALEGAGAGLWDWDMVKDQVVYSTRWKRMLGYEDHEVEDAFSGWKDLWRPDDRPRIEKALDDDLSGKTSDYEIVHRLRHKDGTWRWIVTRGGIIRDPAGKPLRWVGTNIDITERKRLEAELASGEQDFRAFFDAIDDIIVVGAPDGRIVYANPAVPAKLGYSAAEARALQVLDLNPTDRRAEAEAIFAAMLRGERDSCPLPLQSKSGALVPAETRVWFGRWDGAECVFGVRRQ